MDIGNIIQTARYKREALRDLRAWIRSLTDLGMKHADILEKLNAAGWVERFGDPLELSRYHVELAIIKRSARPRSLSVPKTDGRPLEILRAEAQRAREHDQMVALVTPASIQNPPTIESVKNNEVQIRDAFKEAFSEFISPRTSEGEE